MSRLRVLLASVFLLALSACGSQSASSTPAEAEGGAAPAVKQEAALSAASASSDRDALRDALVAKLPEFEGAELYPTPVEGLYELSRGMNAAHVTADGNYLIAGDLIDLTDGRRITEDRRKVARQRIVREAGKEAITFGANAEHQVTVFTDIDCGYCRKLHAEIDDYVEAGIGVRYLMFPRAGKDSDSYRKAVATWCSEDQRATITAAKRGEDPGSAECPNPVDDHLLAGQELGLRGTPMIVLPDGEVVPGYVPADRLAAIISSPPQQDPVAASR